MQDTKTDFLVIGAGPAGGALSCFLGEYGLSGIMIAAAPGTSDTPRAHITNLSAMECLRDISLEKTCLAQATSNEYMKHTRWGASMAGEEYARVYSWGNDPQRHGDYTDASPCGYVDLPQSSLEPILIERALSKGWDIRFDTTLLKIHNQGAGSILAEVKDNKTDATYTIQSKYLFGCDGARSQVIRELALPLIKKPGGGLALNVHVEADLTHLVKSRVGNLHWTINNNSDLSNWSQMVLVRMVQPWREWIFSMYATSDLPHGYEPTEEECKARVCASIGDPSVSVRIIGISKWHINETVAEYYSKGDIFCLGDAVHRHPPANGLGSNTSIQDAYNLAWKIAYVAGGQASPALLESYSAERQPVGVTIITRANEALREQGVVWKALGVTEATAEARTAAYNELQSPGIAGVQRRQMLQKAIRSSCRVYHALGTEMNQQYEKSSNAAVYLNDEAEPRSSSSPQDEDLILHYQQSTYPGSRLPHAWLNTRVPGEQISIQDLAGHGAFVLFTGVGGKNIWQEAANQVKLQLSVSIKVYSIGWMQDWEDVYFDWDRKREVEETGAVLVRPDRFVAWRAQTLDGAKNLVGAMKSILRK